VCSACPVEDGAVVEVAEGVEAGEGGGERGGEGVEVWFHKPGERFEVDELYCFCGAWIAEDGLHAATFLAVTGERAGGVKWRGGEVDGV